MNSNFEILEVSQSDVFSNWKAIKEIIFPQTLKLSVLPVADVSNTLTNSYFGHQIKLSDSKDTSFFVTISDDCNQCSSNDKFYKIDNQVSHNKSLTRLKFFFSFLLFIIHSTKMENSLAQINGKKFRIFVYI